MPNQIKSLSKGLKVYRFIVDYGKPILAVTLCEKLQKRRHSVKNASFLSFIKVAVNAVEAANKITNLLNFFKFIKLPLFINNNFINLLKLINIAIIFISC